MPVAEFWVTRSANAFRQLCACSVGLVLVATACSGSDDTSGTAASQTVDTTVASEDEAVREACQAVSLYLGALHSTRIPMAESLLDSRPSQSAAGPVSQEIWTLLEDVAAQESLDSGGNAGSLLVQAGEICIERFGSLTDPNQAADTSTTSSRSDGGAAVGPASPDDATRGFLEAWQDDDRDTALEYSSGAGPVDAAFDDPYVDPTGGVFGRCEFTAGEVNGQVADWLCEAFLPDGQSIQFYVSRLSSGGFYVLNVGFNGNPVGWEPID